MSNAVTSPFPVFYDRTGQPLDAGYIYIGTAGINPEVSPITVYWDTTLTTSAAQPIRTLNGYPSNSGSPGQPVINASSYSITVRDNAGVLVYTNLNYVPIFQTTFPETGFQITKPATGSTLAGNVIFDANANTIRIYENGGAGRGVLVDIGNAGSKSTLTMNDTAQTLSSKTLTSPTINGGVLSGTFSGAPTFSGAVILSGSPTLITPAINGGTIQSRVQISSETTGTLTSASANKQVNCTGGITLANSVFTAGDKITFDPDTSARTFTRGAGIAMYVNGVDSASATLAANRMGGVHWRSASVAILIGAFT